VPWTCQFWQRQKTLTLASLVPDHPRPLHCRGGALRNVGLDLAWGRWELYLGRSNVLEGFEAIGRFVGQMMSLRRCGVWQPFPFPLPFPYLPPDWAVLRRGQFTNRRSSSRVTRKATGRWMVLRSPAIILTVPRASHDRLDTQFESGGGQARQELPYTLLYRTFARVVWNGSQFVATS